MAKNKAKAKQHPETKLLLFENHFILSSMLPSKTNIRYSKKCVENMCVCFNKIIWLMIMKMRLAMKNRFGHKCTKYKMCFSMMMVMCNKQHVSHMWSWIHDEVKQHWGWVEKNPYL